jgi:hypothetical protein
MRIALSLDLDLAKFDQSRFHISMFRWFELGEEVAKIYFPLLVRSDLLRTCEQLLKIRPITDGIP